ncbi:hypothetical protein HU200_060750 [Digitaria exilis]|uniref:Uncharacterized protein n=1 Tax=Digitaria exilis TaxID=1010633 RepID=A0A835A8W4_9POAL|nr:hypothetical protein HU200_060750 [Digitaria exilis]
MSVLIQQRHHLQFLKTLELKL